MKKLLFLLLTVITLQSSAQTTGKAYSDTTANADTTYATFTVVPSNIMSFQIDLYKLTGTIATSDYASVAGYALLQYTNTGETWFDLNTDTLKFTNKDINSKTWELTKTSYLSYRVVIRIPTGTVTTKATLTYCRRPDENK
ncbi:MAG: hypothetical protein Q8K66_13145 [Sediminibacterium sp.]|nr:hypothetical protein [Sediminibacterium sp.]MDP3128819.1 hypothetical protein [Sediminibacterium sp.]